MIIGEKRQHYRKKIERFTLIRFREDVDDLFP